MKTHWRTMKSAPTDGTRMDVRCVGTRFEPRDAAYPVIVYGLFYGNPPIGKGLVLRGNQNILSPFLKPTHWRISIMPNNATKNQINKIRGAQL